MRSGQATGQWPACALVLAHVLVADRFDLHRAVDALVLLAVVEDRHKPWGHPPPAVDEHPALPGVIDRQDVRAGAPVTAILME